MNLINWVIIGLISFIIQIYVLKHTYTIPVKGGFSMMFGTHIGDLRINSFQERYEK